MPKPVIPAEAHSDDRMVEVTFDAEAYFQQADDEDLLELVRCGFTGDYPSDWVAHYMADRHPGVERLFTYLDIVSGKKDAPGFECSVDEEYALRWLHDHRPHLVVDMDLSDILEEGE